MGKTPEGQLKKQVLELLKRKHAWAEVLVTSKHRMPSGRFVTNGTPGRPDIICFPWGAIPKVVWIETKGDGKHTIEQKAWEAKAKQYGHIYILCKKLEDLYGLFGAE